MRDQGKKIVFFAAMLCGFVVFSVASPPAFSAWVLDPRTKSFLRDNAELKDTDKQQAEYIQQLVKDGDVDSALTAVKLLEKYFPGSRRIAESLFLVAGLLEKSGEDYKAYKIYQRIISDYPGNVHTNVILLHEFEIGVRFLEGERVRYFGVPTVPMISKAIEIFEAIKKTSPYHEYGEKSQYYIGLAYMKQKDYEKALDAFETLLDEYPQTKFAADASFQTAQILYLMSKKTYETEEAVDRATEKFDEYIGRYGENITATEQMRTFKKELVEKEAAATYKTGRYYEKQRRPESAIIYYKEVLSTAPHTKWTKKAQKRLAMIADPESVLQEEKKELSEKLGVVEKELETLKTASNRDSEEYKQERETAEQQRKMLLKQLHAYDKQKADELKLRWEVLERKERELNERKRNLAKKKKELGENPSDDFAAVAKRWDDATREQEFALKQERTELEKISARLGYQHGIIWPFFSHSIDTLDVHNIAAYKKKKADELHAQEIVAQQSLSGILEKLDDAVSELNTSEIQLAHKEDLLGVQKHNKKKAGSFWKKTAAKPLKILLYPSELARSAFVPNDAERRASLEHEKESLDNELSALDDSLAEVASLLKEAKAEVPLPPVVTPQTGATTERERQKQERQARRAIKDLEKQVNEQYRIAADAAEKKHAYANELLRYMKEEKRKRRNTMAKIGYALAKPALAVGRGIKMFLFGIDDEETAAQKEVAEELRASSPDYAEHLDDLRNKIKLETEKERAAGDRAEQLLTTLDDMKKEMKGSGTFRSLLLAPLTFFHAEKKKPKDENFLKTYEEKLRSNKEKLTEERALVVEKMRVLDEAQKKDEGQKQEETTPEAPQAAEQKPAAEEMPAPAVTAHEVQQERQQVKDTRENVHQLKDAASAAINAYGTVLAAAEEVERKRVAKVSEYITSFDGSTSPKYTQLVDLRKSLFARLDHLGSAQQELAVIKKKVDSIT